MVVVRSRSVRGSGTLAFRYSGYANPRSEVKIHLWTRMTHTSQGNLCDDSRLTDKLQLNIGLFGKLSSHFFRLVRILCGRFDGFLDGKEPIHISP